MIASRVLVSLMGACALAIVLFAPRVTLAGAGDQQQTVAVRFGDLNLDTDGGVETLFRRIQIAAVEVCQAYEPRGTHRHSAAHQSCIWSAVSGAVGRLDSPLLNSYFHERERRSAFIVIAGR